MKLAKIESVYRPNLLVNGDFKINQREQTEYTGINNAYTLDMWKSVNSKTKIMVNVGYITIDQSADISVYGRLIQRVAKKSNTSKYVFKVKVKDDKEYILNIYDISVENILDCGRFILRTNQTSDLESIDCEIRIKAGQVINVEYADLFEGSIAYPHFEEDDAIALMRCQEWVYGLITEDYARLPLGHLSSDMIQVSLPFINLKSYATVIMDGNFDIRCIYPNWWDIAYRGSITGAAFKYTSKMFQFSKPSLSGTPDSGQVFSIESQPGARIIITCEPL